MRTTNIRWAAATRVALLAIALVSWLSIGVAQAENLYGVFYTGAGPGGVGDALTLAQISPTGNATPLGSYVTSYNGFASGLGFDQASGKLVTSGYNNALNKHSLLVIDPFAAVPTWQEVDLLLAAGSTVVGVEYVPAGANTWNTPTEQTGGLYISVGPQPGNSNQNNKIAEVQVDGTVVNGPVTLGVDDIDAMAYDPATKYLINTDANNSPFEEFSGNVFGTPTYPTYASPANNGEYYDGAFAPLDSDFDFGKFYVGRRDTSTLWKLNDAGTGYDLIGPFNMGGALPVGLAFAIPEPTTAVLLALGAAFVAFARVRSWRRR